MEPKTGAPAAGTNTRDVLHEAALDQLPDDASVEDAMERRALLDRIDCGLSDARAGRVIGHEEVRARLKI